MSGNLVLTERGAQLVREDPTSDLGQFIIAAFDGGSMGAVSSSINQMRNIFEEHVTITTEIGDPDVVSQAKRLLDGIDTFMEQVVDQQLAKKRD
jgi:hypothetical protein